MSKIYKTAIVGGGASGLAAAVFLSEKFGDDVVVLEKLSRVGKKITVTGNGRGNVTNVNLSCENYHSREGDAPAFVARALKEFGNDDVIKFLNSVGVFTAQENERVYPASFQASSVLDLIRLKLQNNGAEIRADFNVTDIKKGECFIISSEAGDKVFAKTVILAMGGKCQKQFGTDGAGYSLAKKMGHTVTECLPSLVQLKADVSELKALKGIRQEARLTLYDRDMPLICEKGDLLFTEFGVSGNAIFQISGYTAGVNNPILSVEFMPDVPDFEVSKALADKIQSAPYLFAEDLLTGFVNKQVGKAIVRAAGVSLSEKCCKSHIKPVVYALKNFKIKITGTLGFNYAQVTRGGVRLREIDSSTMQSRLIENLYMAGELIDVDGDCGGYNLQWAFSSAYLACKNILKTFEKGGF